MCAVFGVLGLRRQVALKISVHAARSRLRKKNSNPSRNHSCSLRRLYAPTLFAVAQCSITSPAALLHDYVARMRRRSDALPEPDLLLGVAAVVPSVYGLCCVVESRARHQDARRDGACGECGRVRHCLFEKTVLVTVLVADVDSAFSGEQHAANRHCPRKFAQLLKAQGMATTTDKPSAPTSTTQRNRRTIDVHLFRWTRTLHTISQCSSRACDAACYTSLDRRTYGGNCRPLSR